MYNNCKLKLITNLIEESDDNLFMSKDSDDTKSEKQENYVGKEALIQYYEKFHKFSRNPDRFK